MYLILDCFGETSVKSEWVFELKYLQYWFCHVRFQVRCAEL